MAGKSLPPDARLLTGGYASVASKSGANARSEGIRLLSRTTTRVIQNDGYEWSARSTDDEGGVMNMARKGARDEIQAQMR